MDMIAVLHWIQDNIIEFGGDPSNVTLTGHDRGASFANLLMISPMARGKKKCFSLLDFFCSGKVKNWNTDQR